jgi:NitT/TauT family transport system substrate-binding protein
MKKLSRQLMFRLSSVLLTTTMAIFGLIWSGPPQAAELTSATVKLDFIIGGKHAPWFVALEKGFYAKRGLAVTIHAGAGSADTVRTIASGGADFGFADISTTIVARSRGTPIQAVAQLGYVPTTIMWRDDTNIKTLKDLEGKSWAISPGQAQWFLMPAYCRINKVDFKSIRIQEQSGLHCDVSRVQR